MYQFLFTEIGLLFVPSPSPSILVSLPLHWIVFQIEKVPSIDVECLESEDSRNLPRDSSLPPDLPISRRGGRVDPETGSLRSVHSENSFQTCSSEPQLNLVPRQVSDTYKERATPERKSSMRALKQHQQLIQQQLQYTPRSSVSNSGAKPNQNKSPRSSDK